MEMVENNALRTFLTARRSELLSEIEPLRKEVAEKQAKIDDLLAELSDIDKSAEAIGMVNGVQKSQSRALASGKRLRGGTIKDYVVQVLSEHDGGLVALDILAEINRRFSTEFARTSLSPQLSRLKDEGIIGRRGLVWHILNSNEKGPDAKSEPFSSGGKLDGHKGGTTDPSPKASQSSHSTGFHRDREKFLRGSTLSGANPTPNFPFLGKKGG